MFLGAFLFIQLELEKHGPGRGFKFPFLEIDTIAIGRQADAEYIMLVEDEISFLFHPYQIVDPLSFGILPAFAARPGNPGAVLGEKVDENDQAQRRQEKFLHRGCFNSRKFR